MIVFALATVSAMIWNGLLMWGGYVLGVNWQNITTIVGGYNKIVIAVTLVGITGFLIYKYVKRKKYKK